MKAIYWTFGSLALIIALDTLFGSKPFRPMLLMAWLATNFFAYRFGLISTECDGLTGFLGGVPYTFAIPVKVGNGLIQAIMGYLFVGSYCTLWWLARRRKLDQNQLSAKPKPSQIHRGNERFCRTLKISCSVCGGHIEFPTNAFGESIPCPHCQALIILQKARVVKISCSRCGGKIEYPEYAVGQNVACPHCKSEIILDELA